MPSPAATTDFAALGGEPALRAIIERFVDRIFDDTMIGYLFAAADRARIKQKEFEHAAEHLGAGVTYTGRPLDAAHRPHRIRGGQFMRRIQILRETLDEFGVPAAVRERWLTHNLSLQSLVTDDPGGVCDPFLAAAPRERGTR
ncbi:MAG TPA: group 1 truncated hemoglobin [Polyangiaceae bacterium]